MPKWLFPVLLSAILLLAACLRFLDLDWDQGQHLHPDERFLTMVTTDLKWPASFSEFLNTTASPLNPHNKNYNFYVYGTFPVFVTKFVASLLHFDDYGHLILVGRFLSGLLEVGTCLFVYLIGYHITRRKGLSLIPLFLYACLPTPIQLAHFYATDTWVTFFTVLSFYLVIIINQVAVRNLKLILLTGMLGTSLGLLAASKISGLLFLPIIVLALLWPTNRKFDFSLGRLFAYSLVATFACLTLRLAQPYLFTGPGFFNLALNPKILDNWKELANMSIPANTPPFGYQWIPTKPIIYPAVHLFFWGLGIPFSIMALLSLLLLARHYQRFTHPAIWLSLLWVLALFGYEGMQFAKALRYLYPMFPFLALIVGIILGTTLLHPRFRYILHTTYCILGCLLLWNAFAFTSIYTHPHTRVQASAWIYQNIPPDSTLSTEIWDDGLPLTLNATANNSLYRFVALPLYDPDTPEKWAKLSEQLAQTDYVIMSSNRLWRSISSLPQKYPISAPFYDNLLHDRLGFQTVAVFTDYPCLVPGMSLGTLHSVLGTNVRPPPFTLTTTSSCTLAMNDDGAEESFTVYDHPKVIILKNTSHFSATKLYSVIYAR